MKKPRGTIISLNKAQEIASVWYDGDKCPLYQFQSSKTYIPASHDSYIEEIEATLTSQLTNSQRKELLQLKRWFMYKGWEQETKSQWQE